MLYLFNSAYRALYTKNVLNTLFLPNGWTNEYRYTIGENVDRAVLEAVQVGCDTAIVFIDRFGTNGYVYHPLRLGRFIRSREEVGRIFFRVQLGDFMYPEDSRAFQARFAKTMANSRCPRLTNADPMNTNDGEYAILGDAILSDVKDSEHGVSAWARCVEALSGTKAFESKPEKQFVFARAVLRRRSDSTEVLPNLKEESASFALVRNEAYELLVNYAYPIQKTDPSATTPMSIILDETARPLGSNSFSISSTSDSVVFPFTVKRYPEETKGSIQFRFGKDTNSLVEEVEILGHEKALMFEVVENDSYRYRLVGLLVLYAITAIVIGFDFSKFSPAAIDQLWGELAAKIVASIIQASALYCLIRLLGKNIL